MSNRRNFQPPQRSGANKTDTIQMTEEEMEVATPPDEIQIDAAAEVSPSVESAIETDPSVDGILDEELINADPGEEVNIEVQDVPETIPQLTQVEIKAEAARQRKDSLRLFKIRPRVTERLRVPHPLGGNPMWLQLEKGQEITVPKYVRDHLFEKGRL